MFIRKYHKSDAQELYQLFHETVYQVNQRDYSPEQLAVWAKPQMKSESWHHSLAKNYTVVAVKNQQLVGFGDISDSGYLDRLYVHHEYQGQGIAKTILAELEQNARQQEIKQITVAVSLTAKTFFLTKGYQLVTEQQVERDGQVLTNFLMTKQVVKNG